MRQRSYTICRERRGIATLELVLVFPVLLGIVAGLFLIARADLAKVSAASVARRQAWRDRPGAPGGQLLWATHQPADSEISELPQIPVPGYAPFSSYNEVARSGNTLIANPWAYPSIPFPSLTQNLEPHVTVFQLLGGKVATPSLQVLAWTLDPGRNFLMTGASTAGQVANPLVQIAGNVLEYGAGGAVMDKIKYLNDLWDALNWSTGGLAGKTDEGKKIQDALSKLSDYVNYAHNLYEASYGRIGADPFNK